MHIIKSQFQDNLIFNFYNLILFVLDPSYMNVKCCDIYRDVCLCPGWFQTTEKYKVFLVLKTFSKNFGIIINLF